MQTQAHTQKAPVYFTSIRCKMNDSLLDKMARLLDAAGLAKIDFLEKFVAIKIHFGEPGNLSYLRAGFARVLVDKIAALGGRPFLTDCNTLYVGRRNNALVHLDAAAENGFTWETAHCRNIIADGIKGTDDIEVPVPGGVFCKTARIGRAVMDADVFVSLTHFKGHEGTGMGGAIKNIGMGCGSRAGKMLMHNDGKPVVTAACRGCGLCVRYCNERALTVGPDGKALIDTARCVGCGRCVGVCNFHAIDNFSASSNEALSCKMAEYARAVTAGRPQFHVTVVNQVSPFCDCHGDNDAAIVPDIGIFASTDAVALDQACIDAVNAAPAIPDSIMTERGAFKKAPAENDHFSLVHPTTDWRVQLAHAERIGLGTRDYEVLQCG
ncbi:MAG: DUF362 domain-containing protein [Treponema sp.]|jgi:uncharacterized Fe-S center protein|nr:DUF362 domain-containing protein [Treponema sp.]